jgi:phage baseplate assembly protein W
MLFKPVPLYTDLGLEAEIALETDEQAVAQSVTNILRTLKGERDLGFYPEFGSDYHDQLFQPLDEEMAFEVMFGVRNAIKEFEPRVTVDRSATGYQIDDIENILRANVTYRISGLQGKRFFTLILNRYHDLIRR